MDLSVELTGRLDVVVVQTRSAGDGCCCDDVGAGSQTGRHAREQTGVRQ